MKTAETKEQEAAAENMLLRRQVFQLKEANANGISRATSVNSAKSGASKEEPEEKKPAGPTHFFTFCRDD